MEKTGHYSDWTALFRYIWYLYRSFFSLQHVSDEQLKRIAEFGRARAAVVREAEQYVKEQTNLIQSRIELEARNVIHQVEEKMQALVQDKLSLTRRVQELESKLEGQTEPETPPPPTQSLIFKSSSCVKL